MITQFWSKKRKSKHSGGSSNRTANKDKDSMKKRKSKHSGGSPNRTANKDKDSIRASIVLDTCTPAIRHRAVRTSTEKKKKGEWEWKPRSQEAKKAKKAKKAKTAKKQA
jgi:hypothetical protein